VLCIGRARSEEALRRGRGCRIDDHHDEVSWVSSQTRRIALADEADLYRERLLARTRAIKVLDYALQTENGSDSCERFVEMLGLKSFFSVFMGKVCSHSALTCLLGICPLNHLSLPPGAKVSPHSTQQGS
jgi:hypothetical protein